MDPRGDGRLDPHCFNNVMTKSIVNSRTEALKTDINLCFDNKLSNCPLSFVYTSHILQIHVSVR